MAAKVKASKSGESFELKDHVYPDHVKSVPASADSNPATSRASANKRSTAPTAKKQQELDEKAEKARKANEKKLKEGNASKKAEARNRRALEVASVATTTDSSSELENVKRALAEAQGK